MEVPRDASSQAFLIATRLAKSVSGRPDAPHLDGAGSRKVEAWFLGPKGENGDEFERLVIEAVRDQVYWRRNYHPADPNHITDEMKRSPEFVQAAALLLKRDLDHRNILQDVSTFNLHPHLPHLALPNKNSGLEVIAEQYINTLAGRHPFIEAGNRTFHAFLQARPGVFAGDVFVCDATLWSSAFGGLNSLQALWRNLARMPL